MEQRQKGRMTILERIFLAAGLVVLLYCLVVTVWMGPISFVPVLLAGGVGLCLLGLLPKLLPGGWVVFACRRIGMPVVLLGLVVMLVSEGFVLSGVLTAPKDGADYTLVLGAGLRGDQVTLLLRGRLETALDRWQGEKIVVSGGQGPDETVTEASAMARWLREQGGVDPSVLLLEENSRNTMENLQFSRALMEADSGKPISQLRVQIVSSDYHCTRALMLSRRAGYGEVWTAGAPTRPILVPVNHIRESMALVKSFLLDR